MSTDISVTVVAEPAEVTVVAEPSTVVIVDPASGALAEVLGERARALAAEADLQDQIDAINGGTSGDIGHARSTDGSFSLAAPTGVGLELVIVNDALDDIRMNGVSL